MITKYGRDALFVPLFGIFSAKEIIRIMKWGAVVVAAGSGKRMGAASNKPYLPIAGRPVLAYTLEAFERCAAVETVIVVAAAGEETRAAELIRREGFRKIAGIVAGGAERQDSVAEGLAALTTEGVLVHDAARPLVTAAQIEACCRAAEQYGASALAVPVKDTVKVLDTEGMIVSTPDRASLCAVQTPQAFRRTELIDAHRLARETATAATDDAMLLERLGRKVAMVPGDYTNLKITTPEDLLVAELFLARRQGETKQG